MVVFRTKPMATWRTGIAVWKMIQDPWKIRKIFWTRKSTVGTSKVKSLCLHEFWQVFDCHEQKRVSATLPYHNRIRLNQIWKILETTSNNYIWRLWSCDESRATHFQATSFCSPIKRRRSMKILWMTENGASSENLLDLRWGDGILQGRSFMGSMGLTVSRTSRIRIFVEISINSFLKTPNINHNNLSPTRAKDHRTSLRALAQYHMSEFRQGR